MYNTAQRTNVIILAAGQGSRMKIIGSKCALSINNETGSSVNRLVSQLNSQGNNHNIVVVTGFDCNNVVKSIRDQHNVKFAYNPYYATLGSAYSLACAYPYLDQEIPTFILEGDSIYSDDIINDYINNQVNDVNYILSRESRFLNKRSVITLKSLEEGRVLSLVYDPKHKLVPNSKNRLGTFTSFGIDAFESMQIWRVDSNCTRVLADVLNWVYEIKGDFARQPDTKVINHLICTRGIPFEPILVDWCLENDWINLNTQEDFELAKEFIKKEKRSKS